MQAKNQRRLAVIGGLCGAAYLSFNQLLPSFPEILLGLLLGLGAVCMIAGLLPYESWRNLRKWKRRGE